MVVLDELEFPTRSIADVVGGSGTQGDQFRCLEPTRSHVIEFTGYKYPRSSKIGTI